MRALCWSGKFKVTLETVPDPEILNPHDAIVKITSTAICGSDLHLYDGFIPTMEKGDILGHEFMGEVVDVGREVKRVKKGDRIVIPFDIACGSCYFCKHTLFSLCDNTNPNAAMMEKVYGQSTAGLFGYSHMYGGYAGGQAEYARVPHVDTNHLVVPEHLPDNKVLFLSDIFPTGYMAAENCNIQPGDVVAVWGCGPVGQFAIQSAWMLGAGCVIAIDEVPERLTMAKKYGRAETINFRDEDLMDRLKELTGGRGPDSCIDAVGMEAHSLDLDALYDYAKAAMMMETDRPHVLRQAMYAIRKGGTLSIPGVYGGIIDKVPFGMAFAKGVTFKMGQTHTQRYMQPLLDRVEKGELDPSFIISHQLKLEDGPLAYETFKKKEDGCIKVVMKPNG